MNPRLRVLPAPPEGLPGPPGRFGPDACYAPAIWLPILGPASYLGWSTVVRRLAQQPAGITTSLPELAAELGLGSPHGHQAAIARMLRRLERFGILRRVSDELVLVREQLPFASPAQLARLHPTIRARHDRLHEQVAARSC